mgnify:CR=1 FL=1
MTKTPFITADKLDQITAEFPTPFHLYDEKGIRETARAVNAAFSWNPGFKEFFAVKATPNPAILKILNGLHMLRSGPPLYSPYRKKRRRRDGRIRRKYPQ